MKNKKICAYTCITGDYDNLKEIPKELYEKNIDYYCFTNNDNIKSDTWKIVYISDDELDNHMLSRKIKILGHEIINNNYDVSIWMDGALKLNKKLTEFLKKECDLKNYELFCFKHSVRDCIYEEAKACIQFMRDDPEKIKKQIKFLREENYPENYGLCEMTLFARDLHSEAVTQTMKIWFDMLLKYSKRDQLSFMYSVYKTGVKLQQIDLNVFKNDYFKWEKHTVVSKIDRCRIYYGDIKKDYNYQLDYCYYYQIDENLYKISFEILQDTDVISFQVSHLGSIIINDISYYFDAQMKLINIFKINDKHVIFNELGIIQFIGKFKKNQKLEIIIDMVKFDKFSYNVLLKSYYENDNAQNKYIKALEKKKRELERRIRLKNKDYNDMSITYNNLVGAYNNIENVHFDLEKLYRNLEKNYNYMADKYKDLERRYKDLEKNYKELEKKYKNLEEQHNLVINSKGWKTLEKLRKLKK